MGGRLWRDASGRLTCDRSDVGAASYPAVCHAIAEAYGLAPVSELVVGADQMYRDFGRGREVVGLDWDIWMGFMVVAKSAAAEPLVADIAEWLGSNAVAV